MRNEDTRHVDAHQNGRTAEENEEEEEADLEKPEPVNSD